MIEDNLPLLEKTDLILRIRKFSHQPLRVRQGNVKTYPIDMALRNAVLKIKTTQDDHEMGHYAENVVVRELMSWPEGIEVSYYREKDREVDFVLTHGGNRYLPIEVKYRTFTAQIDGLRAFMRKFDVPFGCVVTRELERKSDKGVLFVPLRYFLLAT